MFKQGVTLCVLAIFQLVAKEKSLHALTALWSDATQLLDPFVLEMLCLPLEPVRLIARRVALLVPQNVVLVIHLLVQTTIQKYV